MAKQVIIALSLTLVFLFISCGADQSAKAGENWLRKTKSKKAKVDVTGKWKHGSGEFRGHVWGWGGSSGFGTVVLEQDGNKVKGHVNGGEYQVTGRVRGKIIYLQFVTSNWVYYVLKMKHKKAKSGTRLEGKYLNYLPKKDAEFEKNGTLVIMAKLK